jgi:hypothetical protein
VRPDRSVREIQLLADFAIGETLGGELGDLELLGGQLIASLGNTAAARLARRAELAAGLACAG